MQGLKDKNEWRILCIGLTATERNRKSYDTGLKSNDWRIPYIGRMPTDMFAVCFQYKDDYLKCNAFVGIHKFEWNGYPDCKWENPYDESHYRHFLVVRLFDSGPKKGRIETIEAHHRNYWHTDSDWHDHADSEIYEVCEPDSAEISVYCKLLDSCTKSCAEDDAMTLFRTVVASSNVFDIDVKDRSLKGPDGLLVSIENMASFITRAYSFLEVFFFGSMVGELEECIDSLVLGNKSKSTLSKGFQSFLNRLSIEDFYEGMDFEKLKREFLIRMYRQGLGVQRFLGVSERVFAAMIKNVMEERIGSEDRTLNWRGVECFCWEREASIRGPHRGPMCNSPVGIPDGSLCFFNRKKECVGYVTNDYRAFKLTCMGDNVSVGGIAFDGMVYNSKGECLGGGESVSSNELVCGNLSLSHRNDLIVVGERRECGHCVLSSNHRYVGYVKECKYDSENRCLLRYDWDKMECDLRWIGLVVFNEGLIR